LNVLDQPTKEEEMTLAHDEPATLPDDLDGDTPTWALELLHEQRETAAILAAILAKFDQVADEIMPTIDELRNNAMFKMLVGKKKK